MVALRLPGPTERKKPMFRRQGEKKEHLIMEQRDTAGELNLKV